MTYLFNIHIIVKVSDQVRRSVTDIKQAALVQGQPSGPVEKNYGLWGILSG